jgi:hypothetical protein
MAAELLRQETCDNEAESMVQNRSPGSACSSVISVPSCPPQAGAQDCAGALVESSLLAIFERRAPAPGPGLLA